MSKSCGQCTRTHFDPDQPQSDRKHRYKCRTQQNREWQLLELEFHQPSRFDYQSCVTSDGPFGNSPRKAMQLAIGGLVRRSDSLKPVLAHGKTYSLCSALRDLPGNNNSSRRRGAAQGNQW